MIFLFGSARSGSTWLGKIFDSHPELLYLHEPDISDRGIDLLPYWFEQAPTKDEISRARQYLSRLAAARNVRTVGTTPLFRKSYRGTAATLSFFALVSLSKTLERLGASSFVTDVEVPKIALGRNPPGLVIKSVSALGRAEVLLAADNSIRPLLLIRHPCGFVSSMMRGAKQGVMSKVERIGRLAATRSAIRLGLDRGLLTEADDVDLLAWTWLVSNAEAQAAVERVNGSILIYDAITEEPSLHIRNLFANLELGWPAQTEAFLARSQRSQGDYYSVFRNAKGAAQQWQRELDKPTIDRVRRIVSRDPLGSHFFET